MAVTLLRDYGYPWANVCQPNRFLIFHDDNALCMPSTKRFFSTIARLFAAEEE